MCVLTKNAINAFKTQLSAEWNKPKAKNIKGKWDKREPRDYDKIAELQEDVNMAKVALLLLQTS